MDHRLWMYNMHYETGAGLKPEFIDGVRNFIEHTMILDIFKINGLVRYPCSAYSSVQLTPELSTQIWKEKVVGETHKGRCYGPGSHNDVRRLQSGLEGIGSSRQAEALDGVQIVAMSDQIAKFTAALAESERKRVAEQQSMSETVQQIKEQVMNLARRPTTSAPDDTDDESDEDDYVDLTP
ncbi:hypothetical protein MTR67_052952 [Solanum verrucosum]|uniref:Uncharacterized protein n=1 Tax=Solanum verrucosum TaxID=315347 RepID=A0AAF1A0D5_SOLVR|nr:hypothetical protein MTR67_052952 [Solanum verrucosum]